MDTINVKFTFSRELTQEEVNSLVTKHRYIEKIKRSNYSNTNYQIGFSIPKYFSATNAYLANTEDFNKFKSHIIELFSPITKSAIVSRVDTPFTYWMLPGYTYESYAHLFKFMSLCYSISNNKSSTKYFADALTDQRESFIMGDQSNLNKANTKIVIYDQNKKLHDFDSSVNKTTHQRLLKEFPDLPRRIRIEVSRKTNIALENLSYTDQYQKSYNYLKKHLFDEKVINKAKETLTQEYIEKYPTSSSMTAAYHTPVFEYNTFRDYLKYIHRDKAPKTLEGKITRLRTYFDTINKQYLFQLRIKNFLPSLINEIHKQIAS